MSDRVIIIHERDTPIPVTSEPGSLVVVREPSDAVVVRPQTSAVRVPAEAPDTVVVREIAPTVLAIASPAQGPPGVGPPGSNGQPRFTGDGPPGVLIGANPGDEYLDNLTGDLYRLS